MSRRWALPPIAVLLPGLWSSSAAAGVLAQERPPLADNSFLVEEAYNQDPGVVQHISAFSRGDDGSWVYSFTQEWPFMGRGQQLSYAVPIVHGSGTGIGDLQLNWRWQATGDPDARLAVSPRFSAIVPTGSTRQGRGAGSLGGQFALPISVRLPPAFALHANAGLTWLPRASNPAGDRTGTVSYFLGASGIWFARSRLNLLVEWIWQDNEVVTGSGGATQRDQSMFFNPGVRLGWDLSGGLQIVPGVAYTVGVGPSSGQDGLFLYLSFEHPFRRE